MPRWCGNAWSRPPRCALSWQAGCRGLALTCAVVGARTTGVQASGGLFGWPSRPPSIRTWPGSSDHPLILSRPWRVLWKRTQRPGSCATLCKRIQQRKQPQPWGTPWGGGADVTCVPSCTLHRSSSKRLASLAPTSFSLQSNCSRRGEGEEAQETMPPLPSSASLTPRKPRSMLFCSLAVHLPWTTGKTESLLMTGSASAVVAPLLLR
mmetsp:Transcript_12229/g.28700  ORF Transcript_12229/g.28700 Transcript_12229/m.28700 type:complete len:208 (+) Transcript_12229:668-1291(+)